VATQIPERRKRKQRGSDLIEFTLVMIPLLGMIAMIFDVAWMSYTRSTLLFACTQGTRYAMANRLDAANSPVDDVDAVSSIKSKVVTWSNGLLKDKEDLISVEWQNLDGVVQAPDPNGGNSANAAGNIVIVSVNGYSMVPLLSMFYSKAAWTFVDVSSADRMD